MLAPKVLVLTGFPGLAPGVLIHGSMEHQKRLSKLLFSCLILIFMTVPSLAQGNLFDPARIWGHVFAAPGAFTDFDNAIDNFHLGGGVAGIGSSGLGGHAELGISGPFENFWDGFGVFSTGLTFAFKPDSRTVPFVNGGYTLVFRSGSANGIHFGGGVNHWFNETWGIGIEGRDHIILEGETIHIIQARVSLLIR